MSWILLSDAADKTTAREFVEAHRRPLGELRESLADLLPPRNRERLQDLAAQAEEAGFPAELAAEVAALEYLPGCMGVIQTARTAERPLEQTAHCFYALGERLGLGWLREQLSGIPPRDRWERIARGGLVMDLHRLQGQLTLVCLTSGQDPEAFLDRVRGFADRYLRVLEAIHEEGGLTLAGGDVLARLLWLMVEGARREEG